MKHFFVVLALFAAAAAGLFSQELSDAENIITAVSVSGLKRTKPHIIEKPLERFVGRNAESINTNEVYALVESSGVLEPLSLEIVNNQGGGKTLAVTVREKWSVFPMPIVSVGSGGWGAGLAFVDTNVLGVKNMMALIGMYRPDNWMAGLMFIDTPDSTNHFGWNLMSWFSLRESKDTDQTGKEVLRRYNVMSINPSAGLSYSFSEFITVSMNLSYQYSGLRETSSPVNTPGNGTEGIGLSPNIAVRRNAWDGYLLNENRASLRYEYTFVIDGDAVHSMSANAVFNHSIIPGFRISAKSGVVFASPSASPFFLSSPMSAAVNILSSSYSAVNLAGASLGLEKYLLKFKFGTVSILAAYQGVYSHGDLLAHQFDHGVLTMLQMYFSRIAIPGAGLGAAYNLDKDSWQFAFNIGMSF